MPSIPFQNIKINSEMIIQNPIRYSRARISGSKLTTYNLHSRGICMPGEKDKFMPNPTSSNSYNDNLNKSQQNRSFQLEAKKKDKNPTGPKFFKNNLECFTYSSYAPNDDEALEIAINACYKQVFGNLKLMESERPIDIERRLRNGDISIKQFIRELSKSPFYLKNYFHTISQISCIKLTFKHILGRPPLNNNEIIRSTILMKEDGFNSQIDLLIDSNEYNEVFGEDVVPYMRTFSSEIGLKTLSFLRGFNLSDSFSSSDNYDKN